MYENESAENKLSLMASLVVPFFLLSNIINFLVNTITYHSSSRTLLSADFKTSKSLST